MNYNKKTVYDADVKGKKVLLRCDFNVPQDKTTGEITSDKRIVAALPTIQYMIEQGARVILCSHMGKPHNVFNEKLKLNKKELAKIAAPFYEPGNLHVLIGSEGSFSLKIVDFEPESKMLVPLEVFWPWYRRRKLARKAERYLARIRKRYTVLGKTSK